MKIYNNLFNNIAGPEPLFSAWDEFRKGKRNKKDVLVFEENLERNIFELSRDIQNKVYKHGGYTGFLISDPKVRNIHKASVRDRVLHHALFKVLNPVFEPGFISTSFSCRIGKGTHKGVDAVASMLRQTSRNNKRQCFALKCDIKKFFDSVDHTILISILSRKIKDPDTMDLLTRVIESYTHFAAPPRERERERAGPGCD